jgi:transposase-like protein
VAQVIVSVVHSQIERRYICHTCGKTFAETRGTPLYGLKRPLRRAVLA